MPTRLSPLPLVCAVAALVCVSFSTSSIEAQPGLRIVVISGEDAVNVIQQKTAVAPVVEVWDRNNQPVAGAVVRFAIQRGQATFNGARALTVTTNAAGRAVATGLTPTGSGALQIGATATFQGQTATATIAQVNVMTAAEVAQAAAAPGGGGSAGTIAVISGAVAGGIIAARELTKEEVVESSYLGAFTGAETIALSSPSCVVTQGYGGQLFLTLDISGTNVSGDGNVTGSSSITGTNCPGGAPIPSPSVLSGAGTVTGTTGHLTFTTTRERTQGPASTETFTFEGAIDGDAVVGTLTHRLEFSGGGVTGLGTGTVSLTVPIQ